MVVISASFFYGAGIAITASVAYLYRNWRSGRKSRSRSLSFNSNVMLTGAFPAETAVVSPIINIVTYYESLPSVSDIEKSLKENLVYFDRFRCAIKKSSANECEVVDDGSLDILKNHIINYEVNDEVGLLAEVDRIVATDFADYEKIPLWRVVRVENKGAGVSAILFRVHHVIGDGISLVATMSKLFNLESTGQPLVLDFAEKMRSGDTPRNNSAGPSKFGLILSTLSSFFEILGLAATKHDSNIVFTDPNKVAMTMADTSRRTVYFPSVGLEFIKAIKTKAACTVNDVLLAATTGAIRRYCEGRGDKSFTSGNKLQSRVLMPVAFPRPQREMQSASLALRNKWAFLSVPIPISGESCKERILQCNATTEVLKKSPLAYVQMWVQSNLLPLLPQFLQRKTAFDIITRHSMVFSNVPGPQSSVTLCGKKLMGVQIIFPNILPQVIILSYGGQVFFNMSIDPAIVKDGDKVLPKLYLEELHNMAKSFGVSTDDAFVMPRKSAGGIIDVIN